MTTAKRLARLRAPDRFVLPGFSGCSARPLMRRLVLLDDRGRNTAALAYLVSPLPCPRPDLGAPLPSRARSGATAPTAAPALARVVDVLGEIFAKFACVFGSQVDLVGRA